MSSTINGTKIRLTRGDSFWATSTPVYRDGTPYQKQTHDVVRFALKSAELLPDGSDFADGEPLVEKELVYDSTNGYWVLHLVPSDTAELAFGDYRYDIELSTNWDSTEEKNTDAYTYIANAKFKLTPEVE